MAINVSKCTVYITVALLPDIILVVMQGYYHWGTHLKAMKRLYF